MLAEEKSPEVATRVGRNIASTYLARFLALASALILVPVVADGIGTEGYGLFALVASMAALFQNDLGMAGALTRFVARGRAQGDMARVREYASSAFAFFLVVGGTMALSGFAVMQIVLVRQGVSGEHSNTSMLMALLGSVGVFAALLGSPNGQILVGFGRLDVVNAVSMIQSVVRIGAMVVAMHLSSSVLLAALVDNGIVCIFCCVLWLVRRRLICNLRISFAFATWSGFREMFSLGLDLLVLGISSTIVLQAGSLITAVAVSVSAVAYFSVAQRAYQLSREVTNSLTQAVLPEASRIGVQNGVSGLARIYLRGTALSNSLVLAVCIPLVAFMGTWLNLWVGPDLAQATISAQILVLSMLVNNNHLFALPVLTAQGRVRLYAGLHVCWAILSVVLGYSLGSLIGLNGVALGVALPVVLLEPIYILHALRRLDISGRQFVRECVIRQLVVLVGPGVLFFILGREFGGDVIVAVLCSAVWLLAIVAFTWGMVMTADERASISSRFRS